MHYFILIFLLMSLETVFAAETLFEQVRSAVFSDPYEELPQFDVSKTSFGPSGSSERNLLLRDAERTLSEPADFASFGRTHKLFQPNGICFSARWIIDKSSPFTGLFRQGAEIPAIVRISVMLSGTTREDRRALGMAIKLFPSGDKGPVNVLVMESMGGRYLAHVIDAVLDNHPGLGNIPKITDLGTLLRIRKDLKQAQKRSEVTGINLRYLPLTHIAAVDTEPHTGIVSPRWVRFSVADQFPRIDAEDFRNELRLHHYPERKLIYEMAAAADNGRSKSSAEWQEIGKLVLEDDVISKTCDTRLHFTHHGDASP